MDGKKQPPTQHYDAFISYSHSADVLLAPELQRLIRRVGRPWYARSRLKIFRDQTDLEMSESLWGSIETALGSSGAFVLVASRTSARSPWVDREVKYWRDHRSRTKFYILLSDGEIVWNERDADFDRARTTALPPSVFGWFDEEPGWLDVRQPPGLRTRRGQRNDRLRDAARTVAAPLYGLRKEDLDGVDEREHRRARRMLGGGISALVLLAVLALVAAGLAYTQYQQKDQQLRLQIAENLGKQASDVAARDPGLASKLALAGWQEDSSSVAARAALLKSYISMSSVTRIYPDITPYQPSDVRLAADGADVLLFAGQVGATFVRSFRQSPQVWDLPSAAKYSRYSLSADGRYVAGIDYSDGRAAVWDTELRTGPVVVPGTSTYSSTSFATDGTRLVLLRNDHAVEIVSSDARSWASRSSDQVVRLPAPLSDGADISDVWLSDDRSAVTVQSYDALGNASVSRVSTGSGEVTTSIEDAAAAQHGQLTVSCNNSTDGAAPATITVRDVRTGAVLRNVALLKADACTNRTQLRLSADDNHVLEGNDAESGFGTDSQQFNSINLTSGMQYSYLFAGQRTPLLSRDGIGLGSEVWAEDQPVSGGAQATESTFVEVGGTFYELGQIKQNRLAMRSASAAGPSGVAVPDPTGARVYVSGKDGGVFDAATYSLVCALPDDPILIDIRDSTVDIADISDPTLVAYRYSLSQASAAPLKYVLGPTSAPGQDLSNNRDSWAVAATADRVGGVFGGTVIVRSAADASPVFPPWPLAVTSNDQTWFDAHPALSLRPGHPSQFATVLPDGTIGVDDGAARSRVATLPTKVREPSNMGHALAFDSSGTRLADMASDGSVEVWDVDAQRKILTTPETEPGSGIVGFTSDGYVLTSNYTVSNNRITELIFWDLGTGLPSGVAMDGSEVLPAAVSDDGHNVQIGNQEIMPVTIPANATAWAAALCGKQGLILTDADRRLLPSASGVSQLCT